jgi:hypothetical protein
MRLLSWIAALVALSPVSALAWHDTGHMVVAAIAYDRLSPAAKSKVDSYFGSKQGFLEAACWADDNKSRITAKWHFYDRYFGEGAFPEAEQQNVVWAIRRFSTELGDSSIDNAERTDALRYLIHFVGDIHMPLHCASRVSTDHPKGDRGGNSFKITGLTQWSPKPKNLHFLWDEGCGLFSETERPLDAASLKKIVSLETVLVSKYGSAQANSTNDMNPDDWSMEGLKLAQTVVYQLDEGSTPSDSYLAKGQEVCGKRVVAAGYRLAALLNKALS